MKLSFRQGIIAANMNSGTPATATDTGIRGQIFCDASYLYVCIAADTWVRTPIATW